MQEYNANSTKQDSKRFNSHGRRNTLPIWVYYVICIYVRTGVADPDPKDPHHCSGSGNEKLSMDPDPDLNLAQLKNVKTRIKLAN